MALRPCSTPGCTSIVERGRCTECNRAADRARGSGHERGYSTRGHRLFRAAVLARDPVCKICFNSRSEVADHFPISRRDLVSSGLDPNDPIRGRGLCKSCHDRETAQHQPGGWNLRDD